MIIVLKCIWGLRDYTTQKVHFKEPNHEKCLRCLKILPCGAQVTPSQPIQTLSKKKKKKNEIGYLPFPKMLKITNKELLCLHFQLYCWTKPLSPAHTPLRRAHAQSFQAARRLWDTGSCSSSCPACDVSRVDFSRGGCFPPGTERGDCLINVALCRHMCRYVLNSGQRAQKHLWSHWKQQQLLCLQTNRHFKFYPQA